VATVGALLTEFSGVAVVGEIFGVPRIFSKTFAAGFLLAVVWTGSYRRVERVGGRMRRSSFESLRTSGC